MAIEQCACGKKLDTSSSGYNKHLSSCKIHRAKREERGRRVVDAFGVQAKRQKLEKEKRKREEEEQRNSLVTGDDGSAVVDEPMVCHPRTLLPPIKCSIFLL